MLEFIIGKTKELKRPLESSEIKKEALKIVKPENKSVFKASQGWYEKFKRRNNIEDLTSKILEEISDD